MLYGNGIMHKFPEAIPHVDFKFEEVNGVTKLVLWNLSETNPTDSQLKEWQLEWESKPKVTVVPLEEKVKSLEASLQLTQKALDEIIFGGSL